MITGTSQSEGFADTRREGGTRHYQTPVFFIDEFKESDIEHQKGMITVRMNARQALDLVNLIKETDLEQRERHLFAFQAQLQRWYDIRFESRRKRFEAERALQRNQSQISEAQASNEEKKE